MQTGAITSYIDVAQLALYGFWIFFAGLIFYLRREDKREGYPLQSDRSERIRVQGFPPIPRPKTFLLPGGATRLAPRSEPPVPLPPAMRRGLPGSPLLPTGDPMADAIGPAAYAMRADVPDVSLEGGGPRIVPLRVAGDFSVAPRDFDPLGATVIGADGAAAGRVVDLWVDRSEVVVRYLEVTLLGPDDSVRVLLPIPFTRFDRRRRRVRVKSILAGQFAGVPKLQHPDQVTLREEDRIAAYYASGHLYAMPGRLGPVL
jgi:photosynthetic reaction center H subunit